MDAYFEASFEKDLKKLKNRAAPLSRETMSRRDTYHQIVKNALIREGWTITHDPYMFRSDPELSTDLGAERTIAAEREGKKLLSKSRVFCMVRKSPNSKKRLDNMNCTNGFYKTRNRIENSMWQCQRMRMTAFCQKRSDKWPSKNCG